VSNALLLTAEPEPKRCKRCGSARIRRLMSRFSVRSESRGSDDADALSYRPRDFLEQPAKFERAMKSVEKRTGMKLRGERVDEAMHRLSKAKRES
jgi:hypothetical protein